MPWYIVSQGGNVVRSMVEGYTTCYKLAWLKRVHVIFVSALPFSVDGCGM